MIHFYRILLLISLSSILIKAQIFVSPTGEDTNPGTFELPLKNISTAVSKAQSGDTIYLRGGVYSLSTRINISKSGNEASKYHLIAYNGERPILDFSSMPVSSSNRGISLSGSYWYMYGIDVKGAGDNGMFVGGSYNKVEFCAFYENSDTGLQLGSGAHDNKIINCDSYFNVDPGQGNADGFAPKLDVGTNNYFYGCRAWQNSDDGWDGYMRGANDVSTTLENCWCFMNGYLKNGSASSGNGNGYKMGGSDDKTLMHNFTLKNCIAFDNRVKGFDQNNNKGSMTLYNCTGYKNGTNYSISSPLNSGKTATVVNGVALGGYGSLGGFVVQQTNSWQNPFLVTNADFISIDTSGVREPRKSDGSLPDINFLHLAAGSDLIDAGTDVGLPYSGTAPDLGAFETGEPSRISDKNIVVDFKLEQNFPNPFNPSTKFFYQVNHSGNVALVIFNLLGEKVAELINEYQFAGSYEVNWFAKDQNNKQLQSGVYLARLTFDNYSTSIKISLIK